MHLHVLGICGTFMGGLAALARAAGHRVTGSDANIYPPMSTQLAAEGIELIDGYDPAQLDLKPDVVVVGNVMTRGKPIIERLLDSGMPYVSGPQWLAENVLRGREVAAVAGTHGKTTTSSMLAWILQDAGREPGFLIGGIPANFDATARAGGGALFVIEADEYDTAFFDKRAKFVHYRPRHLLMTNLEYDHADIYPDLASIQRQFHHLVRTVPGSGRITWNADSAALKATLAMGAWTPLVEFAREGAGRVARTARLAGRQRVRGAASRRTGRHRALAAHRPAQRRERPRGDRLRGRHRRAAGPGRRGARPLRRREAPARASRRSRRHPRL